MSSSALKAAVLVEMLAVYGVTLGKAVYDDFLIQRPAPNELTGRVVLVALSKHALQNAIAVGGLLAVLTVATDLGAGALAAAFGLLILLGFLLTSGADALAAVVSLQREVFAL